MYDTPRPSARFRSLAARLRLWYKQVALGRFTGPLRSVPRLIAAHGLLVVQVRARGLFLRRPARRARPDHRLGRRAELPGEEFSPRLHQGRATACSFITRAPIPPCIAGIAEVVRAGHPDPTAFDPEIGSPRPQERHGQPDLVPGLDPGREERSILRSVYPA